MYYLNIQFFSYQHVVDILFVGKNINISLKLLGADLKNTSVCSIKIILFDL